LVALFGSFLLQPKAQKAIGPAARSAASLAPPDFNFDFFATTGTWDCITRGKKLIATRCVYACVPTDGEFGLGIIFPTFAHIKQACPKSKVDCPHFIQVDPGVVILFKIAPDPPIVENSCIDFKT